MKGCKGKRAFCNIRGILFSTTLTIKIKIMTDENYFCNKSIGLKNSVTFPFLNLLHDLKREPFYQFKYESSCHIYMYIYIYTISLEFRLWILEKICKLFPLMSLRGLKDPLAGAFVIPKIFFSHLHVLSSVFVRYC